MPENSAFEASFGEEIELGAVADESGQITIIEASSHAGFRFERIYFLHSLAEGAQRGGHAHRELYQLMIPINGSFQLELTHLGQKRVIEAKNPNVGIFVPPLTWRVLRDFSPGAVCLVLASAKYEERDYIRSRAEFDAVSAQKRARSSLGSVESK